MAETVKSVEQMLHESAPVDKTAVYERLWAISKDLRAKIDARFTYERDPGYADLDSYGGGTTDDGRSIPGGELHPHVGPELDWFVHSWMGNPTESFSNIHVTAWLAATIKVPHLGFAFGTLPNLWCYIDFQPRSDLQVDVASLDRYYEPLNEKFLEIRARQDLNPFISRELYVRQSLSETAFCFSCEDTEENLDLIEELAHWSLDHWLGWLEDPEPVPVEEQAALAERDLTVRRLIAERDPANVIAASFFGEERMQYLVEALWGKDRELSRPHEA